MASKTSSLSWLLLLSLATILFVGHSASQNDRKAYIVYMGERGRRQDEVSTSSLHTSMLQEVIDSNTGPESLLYSYKRSFNGFAAKLTKEEARRMAGMEGVVSIFPNKQNKLHTTRSWDFLGFSQQVERTTVESDIIIGVLDSGIWPESDSFSDKGFGPPPSKWKGTCRASTNFTCNNKIVGARYYHSNGVFSENDIRSPRDSDGHGTHTASIAAGNVVNMASVQGLGSGTARGGVPSARIAVYKVCWLNGCSDADILAAFDDAIADGVDLISISIGGTADSYFKNSIAIGAFHAMKNGILTSNSAGNRGPGLATLTNISPWSLSVAASAIDRKFFTEVQLGNDKIYEGISINTFDLKNKMYPMIYGGDAPNTTAGSQGSYSRYCQPDSLDQNLVKGKIVLCDLVVDGEGAFQASAVGTVIIGPGRKDVAYSFPLPASYLGIEDGTNVYIYLNSTRSPTATILKTNERKDAFAPYIPPFSSRGPNVATSNILKPDLAAPGLNILAAWSPISPISEVEGDNRKLSFNILSGTSMACPHATGAAAYVKSLHPKWSPAAIKSALMTTADPMSAGKNPEAEFAYGAGNINPSKAPNPGLIYDIDAVDYIKCLCGQGYNTKSLQLLTGDNSSCSDAINGTVNDLNYPAFALSTPPLTSINRVFNRIVTNVGSPTSTYKAILNYPLGLRIKVTPSILSFTSLGQKLPYTLTIKGTIDKFIVTASLTWDDGTFQVRSPIAVFFP
ncbi:cucumisin-like isoform X2 [Carya illinoinensis]|uniref:cucumisin-like isoform X2 n=1 Tax=Carya illinoinensis TaxID=32201 RepID=UPI001C718B0C|nr:cucumisin-like isoform X2 [Carya illinoinensis]